MMKTINSRIIPLFIFIILSTANACKESYTPKPIGYHRIEFPQKAYKKYQSDCPFTFEYPVYGKIVHDTSNNAQPCWINIVFPEYGGKIHFSYKKINHNLSKYVEDSWTFVEKHMVKADGIEQKNYRFDNKNVYGLLYDIEGNVASSVQFFLTDSTNHFLRGSLYFNTQPNKDSLAPAIKFFRKDIIHIIQTFQWNH